MAGIVPGDVTLRSIRARVSPETASRIKYARDPLLVHKLLDACGGDLDALTETTARRTVFISEADFYRTEIGNAYKDRYES